MLEIGAGTGMLTLPLAAVARQVVAVELDPALARRLGGRWRNVTVVEGDAFGIALLREPFVVVANLPFARATELLHTLLDDATTPLVRADLIVEWAVACRRGLPWPSTLDSVVWGVLHESRVSRRIRRTDFAPTPGVDAGVLVFERRREPLVPARVMDDFRTFVARGFRHGLRSVVGTRELDRRALHGTIPRDLDAHAWAALFRSGEGRT